MILGRCPKPRRFGLAILRAFPHGLRYRLMPILTWGAPNPAASRWLFYNPTRTRYATA